MAGRTAALAQILKHLPSVQYAAAYGSGVLKQPGLYPDASVGIGAAARSTGSSQQGPMLDFILAVDDPVAWHAQNIKRNPTHYSWVAELGAHVVAGIAKYVGAGVHFNPMVPLEGQLVKYGVISTEELLDDLTTWRYLYLAGRLQKPVATIQSLPQINAASAYNVTRAALTALLLLPQRFTTQEFLQQVVGLSYTGDVRMMFAEDPHKVSRIVAGSREALEAMYLPLLQPRPPQADVHEDANNHTQQIAHQDLQEAPQGTSPYNNTSGSRAVGSNSLQPVGALGPESLLLIQAAEQLLPSDLSGVQQIQEDMWTQSMDADTRTQLLAHLPPALMTQVGYQVGYQVPESHCAPGSSTALELAHAVVKTSKHTRMLATALSRTVRSSSAWQAVSGALSAGGGKVAAYVIAKVSKAYNSSKPQLEKVMSRVRKS